MPSLPSFDCDTGPAASDIRSALVKSGVAELHHLLPASKVDAWRAEAATRYDDICSLLRAKGIDPEKDKVRQREVMRRSPGRLDVRFEPDTDPGWWLELKRDPLIAEVLASLLGADYRYLFSGVVVAQPGARVQHTHRDGGSGLFPEQPLPMPAYAISLFVPLDGFGPEYGPTEFFPGKWLVDPAEDDQSICANLKVGSALLFDYRIPHRGGENRSSQNRTYMYSVLARPWFGDHLNYNEPSLFE